MKSDARFVLDTGILVSGDHDLLALNPFRGIPILTPQGFVSSRKMR